MPIYEFICQTCGTEFEQIRSFSDSSMPACVKCQSAEVVRRMGRPAIHFKGSGWYITDSKKSSDNKGGTKSTAESSESKTETKTESSTESTSNGDSKSDNGSKSESSTTPKSAPAPVASD